MTSEQVLRELSHNRGYFPQRAVDHAQQMQTELAPVLLQALADMVANPGAVADRDDYLLPIYAMFLLARWREPSAFPLLVDLFSRDNELIEEITGDLLTEDLKSLLASVFPGDLAELDRLVCGPRYSQYLRGAAVQSLLVLYAEGEVGPEEVLARYRHWLDYYLQTGWQGDFALSCLVAGSCEMQFRELLPRIELAYQRELVDCLAMTLGEVRQALTPGSTVAAPPADNKHYRYVRDVADAMGWWSRMEGVSADEDPWTDAFEPSSFGGRG